jgi:hypothetical protein
MSLLSASASASPRILVVVPGHGEATRSHVTQANLARIERMRVRTTCWMYVYGTKLSDEMLHSVWAPSRAMPRVSDL